MFSRSISSVWKPRIVRRTDLSGLMYTTAGEYTSSISYGEL